MQNLLEGKTALITGAASGIGAATAVLFAANGAKVIVSDIHEKEGADVVSLIRNSGGEACFIKADVSQPEQCRELIAKTISIYGKLDIAFNNAGISGESNAIAGMSIEGWNKVIAVNLHSVFYCMKYEIEAMLKSGSSGSIINMSSILGQAGFANAAAYVAAKHGVVGLTKNAALEYSAKGIRVNVIGPGFIDTPMLTDAGFDDAIKLQFAALHPIGRIGRPEEVAELAMWLGSDKASFVTGSYYPVDGGYLAR